jgi:hypothetical protein
MAGNPFENQIPNLSAMYGSWNPMTYLKGMQQEDNANAFNQELSTQNQQTTTKGQQDISLADMMNPQKVLKAQLDNATTAVDLPGHEALSDLHQTNAKMARDSYQTNLDELIKGHQFKDKERELQQLEMGGRSFMQAEPLLASIPPPARHAAAKRLLGDLYQPEFDNVPPEQLGQVLNFVGSEMQQSQQRLFAQQMGLDTRGDTARTVAATRAAMALGVQDKRNAGAKDIAEFKANLAEQIAKIKAQGDPKTYMAAATKLLEAARAESDPDKKHELVQQAQQFVELNQSAMEARPQANNAGKVDIGATTGLPTQPGATTPQVGVPGAMPEARNNPIMNDPNMAKLPQGTKALGNGIYQLPDGRKIKAKQ